MVTTDLRVGYVIFAIALAVMVGTGAILWLEWA
jgi:hypothetical protein